MRTPVTTGRALLGLVLGALIVCFAPVVHTLCVAPAEESTHSFSHVMPDGQTMVMGDEIAIVGAVDLPSANDYVSLLGVVLVAGGLALAMIACALACLRLTNSSGGVTHVATPRWHPPPGRPRMTLTLHELSISRT